MSRHHTYSALYVLFALGLTIGFFAELPQARAQSATEGTLWKRVANSGKIRCSYVTYPPYAIKDPNSAKLSGIFVEAVEAIGKKLDLKIEWVEEVGFGTVFEGLDAGRHDVLCSGLWQNSTRGKRAYFSAPLFFNAIHVWVRASETRFKTVGDLNATGVRIAVQDGAYH